VLDENVRIFNSLYQGFSNSKRWIGLYQRL